MELITEFINENELGTFTTIYNDIQNNFANSININPQLKNDIEEVYSRALLNISRSTLSIFNLKYLEIFENLADYYKYNEELLDLSKSLIHIFNVYFKELNDNLNINHEKDFDELRFILEISLITLEEVIEEKNIELAYEAFFQIERSIEKENLYKKSITFSKPGEYEFKFLLDESSDTNSHDKFDFENVVVF